MVYKKMRIALVLASALLVSGCYVKVNEGNVSVISDSDLCSAMTARAASGWNLAREEILRRDLLSQRDMNLVVEKKIRVGMPECGLLAVLGYPKSPKYCGKVNSSTGSYGTHKQYVYRPCGSYGSTKYVYVRNGEISSWQN